MTTTIKTNNVPRPLLSYYELTKKQQEELGEMELEQVDRWTGFVFKGQVYDIEEFMVIPVASESRKQGWDAASSQSAFHAVLVKLSHENFDSVVVGQQFC